MNYEEFLRLTDDGFANFPKSARWRAGETGPRISEETQPTPTNYDKAGITVTLPKYSYRWYRDYYAAKSGQQAPETKRLSPE